ncbi:L-threonylcarbamoyladenylate synthase [Pullulanibacillus pueri]|uniref:Threonylcarbamoyl-AMP synthase n=1 Tax=Pullulanibacillus pueri TaxID=1437324 RepID=A0A8J2ZWT0_9BACL|nr:L-threonylcarbamoyladenylate synthase [Pullulanibacillus pueri]MBM7681718.1 L-threonylcarbamoyladenylate synthase [Pullulanibacillus pueri]GGH84039.1 threonylcarbamoyl-AMP synthase [Pullulanibacillus pueri]
MYETKRWNVQAVDQATKKADIKAAAALIQDNETVAFPTETVYGLGANALSDEAIAKIFAAKGRPSDNPLIVHIAERQQLHQVAKTIPPIAQRIMDAFWPGPITVIVPAAPEIAQKVTAGLDTVGVRMPAHPIALDLLKYAGVPVAAPSANRSGKPSPTSADHVAYDLNGRIAGILDGGVTGVGVESTVVDTTGEKAVLLRPGGISREQLIELLGALEEDPTLGQSDAAPRSPGMKYRHYAPEAPVYLVKDPEKRLPSFIKKEKQTGKHVGVIATEEHLEAYREADVITAMGSVKDLTSVAQRLYDALRKMDQAEVDVIFCETFSSEGIGLAIMNRLKKAANGRIL